MTIGIGLASKEGIVICSDRQHTISGYSKYSQSKLMSSVRPNGCILMTYACNDTDKASLLFDRIEQSDWPTLDSHILRWLRSLVRSDSKGLHTLLAIQLKDNSPRLFRTTERDVFEKYRDYIGLGDCSAVKYVQELLPGLPGKISVEYAVAVAAYLVTIANKYVDGCSGGPDIAFLSSGVRRFTKQEVLFYERFFKRFEVQMGKKWAQMAGKLRTAAMFTL